MPYTWVIKHYLLTFLTRQRRVYQLVTNTQLTRRHREGAGPRTICRQIDVGPLRQIDIKASGVGCLCNVGQPSARHVGIATTPTLAS